MKKTTLGRVKDGEKLIRSRYSRTWYKKIMKEKDGIVITSLKSERSYKLKASTLVYVPKLG